MFCPKHAKRAVVSPEPLRVARPCKLLKGSIAQIKQRCSLVSRRVIEFVVRILNFPRQCGNQLRVGGQEVASQYQAQLLWTLTTIIS